MAGPLSSVAYAAVTFSLLSYNIHGISWVFAKDNPQDRTVTVGWLANRYDVVLLQEDFEYHDEIGKQMTGVAAVRGNRMRGDPRLVITKLVLLPFQALLPDFSFPYGSGLSAFVSKRAATVVETSRHRYKDCSGWFDRSSDCWATKGVLMVRLRFENGAEIDVYTTHLDAGQSSSAMKVREPFIVWTAKDEKITGALGHRYVFSTAENTAMAGKAGAVGLAKKPHKKYYIAGEDYAYGHAIADATWRYLKAAKPDVEKIGETWWKIGEPDLVPYLTSIEAAKPDAVLFCTGGTGMTNCIKAISAMGFSKKIPSWFHTAIDYAVLKPLGAEAPEDIMGRSSISLTILRVLKTKPLLMLSRKPMEPPRDFLLLMHTLQLATLLSELLESIERWALSHFEDEFRLGEPRAAQQLWLVLDIQPPEQPGIETPRAISTELQKQRRRAAEKHRFAHDPKRSIGKCFGADVLQKTCAALATSFSFLRNRPFYFFIDDYSSPKVTKALQENLNRIFMQRTSVCFFKLSTESPVSFSKSNIDQKIYVEAREFILHNLGLVYLHADTQPKLEFM